MNQSAISSFNRPGSTTGRRKRGERGKGTKTPVQSTTPMGFIPQTPVSKNEDPLLKVEP